MSDQIALLKKELFSLFDTLQKIKTDIAAIRHPSLKDDHFNTMADQLDAIVAATETATNTIMESMESVEDMLGKIRDLSTEPQVHELLDKATDKIMAVFEACAFQDITGQRVTRVVKSMKSIEGRVNVLIDAWGKSALATLPLPDDGEKDADKKLLNGPQHEGKGVSQNDIDKMFD